MAPSHGIPPGEGAPILDRSSSSDHEAGLASRATPDCRHSSEDGRMPSVRSPPRARFRLEHKPGPGSGIQVAATPEMFDTAHGRESGSKQGGFAESFQDVGDGNGHRDDREPERHGPKSSSDHLSKPDVSGSRNENDKNRRDTDTSRQYLDTDRQDRDRPVKSVMHEKWGSVFVVGGGQRRRRASVRRRSAEAEDTPAARKAHVRQTAWC